MIARQLYWTPNAANGSPSDRSYLVSTVGPAFVVHRNSDNVPVECVILSNNRLAPVSQLSTTPRGTTPRSEKREPRREKTAEAPLATRNSQLASSTCNVLAIDFLNVLVRAFHAGKPTETHAVRSMFQTVASAIRKLRPAHVVFAMDGGHKLRSELLPQYKAHRPPSDPLLTAQKALAETAIRVAGFQAIRVIDWEADDVLATLATRFSDTVIASCDKDLLAMTGQATRCRIYHPWGDGQMMTAEEKIGLPAHQVTDYLALCGDSSDGIPGVVGIGPKTAVQLLTEYGTLEAIIVAAKLGNIKGATGQKIATQHAAALTCRRVVELNCRLPLPELEDFSPVALWRQKLQDMRLGSVAAILETLTGERFQVSNVQSEIEQEENNTPARETLSAANLQAEQVEKGDSGVQDSPESAAVPDQHRQEVTPSAQHAPPIPNSTEDSRTHNLVGQAVHVAGDDNRIRRSITEPLREGLTHEQRFDGPDRGAIHLWEAGRRCATQNRTENPWKPGTWQHVAWQQGVGGQDLSVDPAEVSKSEMAIPKPTGSLFE